MESLKDVKEGSNTIKCTDYKDCYYAVVFTTKFENDSGALDRVTSLTVGLLTERGSLGAVRAQQPHPQVSRFLPRTVFASTGVFRFKANNACCLVLCLKGLRSIKRRCPASRGFGIKKSSLPGDVNFFFGKNLKKKKIY